MRQEAIIEAIDDARAVQARLGLPHDLLPALIIAAALTGARAEADLRRDAAWRELAAGQEVTP